MGNSYTKIVSSMVPAELFVPLSIVGYWELEVVDLDIVELAAGFVALGNPASYFVVVADDF